MRKMPWWWRYPSTRHEDVADKVVVALAVIIIVAIAFGWLS
jgi:hypothetical protein